MTKRHLVIVWVWSPTGRPAAIVPRNGRLNSAGSFATSGRAANRDSPAARLSIRPRSTAATGLRHRHPEESMGAGPPYGSPAASLK